MKKKLTNKHNGAVLIVEEKYLVDKHNVDSYIISNNKEGYSFGCFYNKKDWELSDYEEPKPQLYYIRGVKDRGNEVIKMLEELGGKNSNYLFGECECGMYFIGSNNVIELIFKDLNQSPLVEGLVGILEKYGTELHLSEPTENNYELTKFEKKLLEYADKYTYGESIELKPEVVTKELKKAAKELTEIIMSDLAKRLYTNAPLAIE